jgi:hypothetical protein
MNNCYLFRFLTLVITIVNNILFTMSFLETAEAASIDVEPPSLVWSQKMHICDYGGPSQGFGERIVAAPDGGYYSRIYLYRYDTVGTFFTKFNSNGDTVWTMLYKPSVTLHYSQTIEKRAEGGFAIFSPIDTYKVILSFFDDNGELVNETISTSPKIGNLVCSSLTLTADSGFIAVGRTSTFTTRPIAWVGRFDKHGNLKWCNSFTCPFSGSWYAIKALECAANAIFVVARSDSSWFSSSDSRTYQNRTTYLFSVNADTQMVSLKRYVNMSPRDAAILTNNKILIAGSQEPGLYNACYAKLIICDPNGDSLGERLYRDTTINEFVFAENITHNRAMVVCESQPTGNVGGNYRIMMVNDNGDSVWSRCIPRGATSTIYDIALSSQNAITLFGRGLPPGITQGIGDVWIASIDSANTPKFNRLHFGIPLSWGGACTILPSGQWVFGGGYELYGKKIGFVIGTDRSGRERWRQSCEMPITHLIPASGGVVALGGENSSKRGFMLMKFNNYGDSIWMKKYIRSGMHYNGDIIPNNDGFIMAGSYNYDSTWILCLNNMGDTLWTSLPGRYLVYDLVQAEQNGFIFVNESNVLVRLDSLGRTLWTRPCDNTTNVTGQLNGDRLLSGPRPGELTIFSGIGTGPNHSLITQTDSTGKIIWQKVHPDSFPWYQSVVSIGTKGFFSAGSVKGKDKYFMFIDSIGDIGWTKVISSTIRQEVFNDMSALDDSNFVMAGLEVDPSTRAEEAVLSFYSNARYPVSQLNMQLVPPASECCVRFKNNSFLVNSTFEMNRISLYDCLGRLVLCKKLSSATSAAVFINGIGKKLFIMEIIGADWVYRNTFLISK